MHGIAPELTHATLHEAIVSTFLQHQRPPTLRELAARFACDVERVRHGLRALEAYHGVVLHPRSDEIWVAHPFSAAPTPFVVKAGAKRWWGNCAWCSLGLAHLAGGSVTIETRLGALDDQVELKIENGKVLDPNYVVHFPVPMRHAWDNVIYTCSVMLLFRDEAQVDQWCATRGITKGDVRPISQVWGFAAEWYAHHADATWAKWSTQQAAELFRRHNLTGPTWALSSEAGRF